MLKVSLSALAFAVSFLAPGTALSANKILNMTAKRSNAGVAIDLVFERPVAAKSLHPDFERNFVQIVLKGTKLDAAKIVPVTGSEVQKIFVYPYNPETARLRLILRKDSAWAKGRFSVWNNNAKAVRIFIKEPLETPVAKVEEPNKRETEKPMQATASQGLKSAILSATGESTAPAPAAQAEAAQHEEKTLLKEVINNTRDIDINNPDSVKAALGAVSAVDKSDKADEKNGAVGIKNDPTKSFARMAIALFGVLGLFLGGVLFVKRYASRLKKLPFGKKERLIQVVATHYLGNKKSISLVKITGEYMVVGVSNDGISLISKLGPEVNVDRYLEDRFWGGTFEKHLDSYAKDGKVAKEIDFSMDDESAPLIAERPKARKFLFDGARDLGAKAQPMPEVKDKVELSPFRASIKEKLTKLKPLA